MPKSHLEFIRHILLECNYCIKVTTSLEYENFINDETLCRATIRSLEIIGEASKRIPPDFKTKYKLVSWKDMAGMRDRLIHDYLGVDYETVWTTLKKDVLIAKEWMELILKNEA
jgi:uncharacterized protein with HEPN domain